MIFRIFLLLIGLAVSLLANSANVILEGCETLSFDKAHGNDCQVLRGNVRFRHDKTLMFCDSAYYYSGRNSFDAFGHVRVLQDSVTMTSNKMFYDGNTKIMRIRDHITLTNGTMVMTTEQLDYFREKDYAEYSYGAKIEDPQFTLTSKQGIYYPKTNQAQFRYDVDLVSPDYSVKSDTVFYNTKNGDARVLGPSHIVRDSFNIVTTNAYMNRNQGSFTLFERSTIVSFDSTQNIVADKLMYNRETGMANAYGNIVATDKKQHVSAKGQVASFSRLPVRSGFLTGNASVMEFSSSDTIYIHADTLDLQSSANDSLRMLHGLHNVRLFRKDFQGKCEMLTYNTADSMMQMETKPVLWSDENQLTGDTIRLYLKNRNPDWMHIVGGALIIQRDDSVNFNQLAGKDMKGYFVKSQLRKVVLKGNSVSIYYPKDNKGDLIGVNRSEGDQMTIFIDEKRKLERILMAPGATGSMYPPFEIPADMEKLKGFGWFDVIRPRCSADIFKSNE